MVIPTIALKVLGGTFVAGVLASSVAVPAVMTLKNTSAPTTLKHSPELQKIQYQERCRLLTKEDDQEERNRKYLFVCKKDGTSGIDFYYYSFGEKPEKFTKLKNQISSGREGSRITVVLDIQQPNEVQMTTSNNNWTDLVNQELNNCSLTNTNNPWTLQCPKEGSGSGKVISLEPITF